MLKGPPIPPGNSWNSLFNNISGQGDAFNKALSDSNMYYGFLSSCDQDEKNGLYYILFEVVPMEWINNVIMSGDAFVATMPPPSPTSCYFINGVQETVILNALGLKTADNLAVGSWYLLRLEKNITGVVTGDLYDPDIDMAPEQ